jgi:radical SAM superfamily enzyme YgiQ (UPF0313 family)
MTRQSRTGILLVNLPFSHVDSPYISIPVLASYLKSRHIEVAAFDLNRALYQQLLQSQQVRRGIEYGLERLAALNRQPGLTFYELYEYWILSRVLIQAEIENRHFDWLYYPFGDYLDIKEYNSHIRGLFIELATLPYFPEVIRPEPRFDVKDWPDCFSSSSVVEGAGNESEYTKMFESLLVPLVEGKAPKVVGFSVVYRHQLIPAFQCARMIKKRFPGIHITLGGPFVSIHFRNIKNKEIFSLVDSLVLDEGEIPLEQLVACLPSNNGDFRHVPGLVYLADGRIMSNKPAPPLNMEEQPPPDYAVFELDGYPARREKLRVPFRLSKGCYWRRCSFCRTDIGFVRHFQQPPYAVIYEQLKHTVEDMEVENFLFSDEAANPELLEYISKRLIRERVKISWFCHTRVDSRLTKERCRLYKEAGCRVLGLGIESFNNRILQLMRKGITYQLIEEVLGNMAGVLPVLAYLIVGFPTETEEEALAGFDIFKRFQAKGWLRICHYNLCMIFYGSEIYRNLARFGISALKVPPGQDLFPDVYDFTGKGMSRKRAYQLMLEFNDEYKDILSGGNLDRIHFLGREIPLKYHFKYLKNLIHDRWDSSYLPFSSWIEKWERSHRLEAQ